MSQDEANAPFGFLGRFAGFDWLASSTLTQQRLGWKPTGSSLVADLKNMRYSEPA